MKYLTFLLSFVFVLSVVGCGHSSKTTDDAKTTAQESVKDHSDGKCGDDKDSKCGEGKCGDDKVKEVAKDVKDATKKAAHEVGDKIEEAGEAIKDAVDK